jgi:hypothetical protein
MSSFHNRKRATQLIDFKGLQWGKMRPTDIDLSIDWGKKTFVFVEVKEINAALTVGQRIHLEGLVDCIIDSGRMAYAIVARHATKATEDIMAEDCLVSNIYSGGKRWEPVYTNTRLGDTLNEMYMDHIEANGK